MWTQRFWAHFLVLNYVLGKQKYNILNYELGRQRILQWELGESRVQKSEDTWEILRFHNLKKKKHSFRNKNTFKIKELTTLTYSFKTKGHNYTLRHQTTAERLSSFNVKTYCYFILLLFMNEHGFITAHSNIWLIHTPTGMFPGVRHTSCKQWRIIHCELSKFSLFLKEFKKREKNMGLTDEWLQMQ